MMIEKNWLPLLQLPGGSWIGTFEHDTEQVWVGTHESAQRQLDVERPIGLLPLLEQPLSVVVGEIEELEERDHLEFSRALSSALKGIIDTAVSIQSDYWSERAVDWMETLGPQAVTLAELDRLIDAHWAPQPVRHKALRLKNCWQRNGS